LRVSVNPDLALELRVATPKLGVTADDKSLKLIVEAPASVHPAAFKSAVSNPSLKRV
jgi:hypothetical protein